MFSRRTIASLIAGAPISVLFPKLCSAVDVKSFGAKGDGITDDTAAIQAAIDAALYITNSNRVVLPKGRFLISDTIHLGYGVPFHGGSYRSVTIEGDGSGYRGEALLGGSTLITSFSDRPAISIQGGRRVRIARLGILGQNYRHILGMNLGNSSIVSDDTAADVWISPQLAPTAASQFTPYAAIAIDPYSGMTPTLHYPFVSYPSFLGIVAQYEKDFSSDITIDDVYIGGFVVGVAIQPGDSDGNGDFITMRDTLIEFCTYGYSVGNSQSRQNNMFNVYFANCHTAITNNKNGRRVGKLGGAVVGCAFDRCIQILDIQTDYAGPISFNGCYGELLWRIGSLGGAAPRSAPVEFYGCEFRMSDHPPQRGIPASYCDGGSSILFHGGYLWASDYLHFLCDVTFFGTKIDSVEISNKRASFERIIAHDWSLDVTGPFRSLQKLPPETIFTNLYQSLDGSPGSPLLVSVEPPGFGRNNPFTRLTERVRWNLGEMVTPDITVPRTYIRTKAKRQTKSTFNGILGEIEIGNIPFGVRPGDLIEDELSGTILLVERSDGVKITVRALNNIRQVGGKVELRVPINTSIGNWHIGLSRLYTTSYPLYGDVSFGSNIIANCGKADELADFIEKDCAIGDSIFETDGFAQLFPAAAKIVEINVRARAISLNEKSLRTGRLLFSVWVRG